jgi:signal transduction histidine kinase
MLQQQAKAQSLEYSFSVKENTRELPEDLRVVLFSSVRELTINVIRHAQASSVDLRMWEEDESVFITVQDDGIGFDALDLHQRVSADGGFGLFNIHERLTSCGGKLTVVSRAGEGTEATVSILSGD